jgi:hypothetical protein
VGEDLVSDSDENYTFKLPMHENEDVYLRVHNTTAFDLQIFTVTPEGSANPLDDLI